MAANWVDDLSALQGKPGLVKKPQSRKEHIEAELKLLEWHKLANEAAIKAALLQTKNIKEEVPEKAPLHSTEDARWMRKVIESEHVRPLQVTKKFVLDYEEKEKENAERLTTQVEKHISTLKKLREKLEDKQEMKARVDEYRSWKKDFHDKKHAVMLGKTIEDYEKEKVKSESPSRTQTGYSDDFEPASRSETIRRGKGSGELSTVLDSLNKLAELEKRITSLEKDNAYDQLLEREKPGVAQRVEYEFRAERAVDANQNGRGVMFSVKKKQGVWDPMTSGGKRDRQPVGMGAMAARAKKKAAETMQKIRANRQQARATGGAGFFLTDVETDGNEPDEELDEAELEREERRRERQRQLALASAGKMNIRNRVIAKKTRAKEAEVGNKKHEAAMKEIQRRRAEVQNQKKKPTGTGPVVPGRGAASGIKTKNKHMQDFEKAKSGFKKKQEAINRGPVANPRLQSQTAPSILRHPTTQTGGTVTRRTNNAPVRRPLHGNQAEFQPAGKAGSAPVIAVSGVGGIKALRGARANR